MIDNTAVRGQKVVWAGCGGQYSVVAAEWDVEGDEKAKAEAEKKAKALADLRETVQVPLN